jgi:L-ascorbate metabolism protein UlaG (beta-lactamase superfamily)
MCVILWLLMCVSACAIDPCTVTALGNEGFLIESGDSKVMIDGLYVGLPGYVAPSDDELEARIQGEGEYAGVDLVLVSHYHEDHFDTDAVGQHLVANQEAILVTSEQASEQLRYEFPAFDDISNRVRALNPGAGTPVSVTERGVEIEVLSLHHGSDRLYIQNLGFIVRLDGCTFLHVGDALSTPAELAENALAEKGIDIAFVPYWYLTDAAEAAAVLSAINADTVIAMHMPAPDASPSYFEPTTNLDGLRTALRAATPGVRILEPGERLDNPSTRP